MVSDENQSKAKPKVDDRAHHNDTKLVSLDNFQTHNDMNNTIEVNYYKGKRAFRRLNNFITEGFKSVIGANKNPRTDMEYIDEQDELEDRKQEKNKKDHINQLTDNFAVLKNKAQDFTGESRLFHGGSHNELTYSLKGSQIEESNEIHFEKNVNI